MAKRYELTDRQYARIETFFLGKASDPGRSGRDNRLFVNAVLWVLRSGARWQDLPARYGKYKSVAQAVLPLGQIRRLGPHL
jgi:transposase